MAAHDQSEAGGVLAVFSGECLKGVCGTPVGFNDMRGKPLHVGDIVLTFTVFSRESEGSEWLDYSPDGLTSVVSDEWETFSNGAYVRKDGEPEFFVMGIKTVPMDDPGQWRVMLVKSHADAVAGEHWPEYGFNYRPAPTAALAAATPKGEQP